MPESATPTWSKMDVWNRTVEVLERDLGPLMKALRDAGKPSTTGASAKLVLIALVRATFGLDKAEADHELIASFASISPRSAIRTLEALKAAGLIGWQVRSRRSGQPNDERSNVYHFHGEAILALPRFRASARRPDGAAGAAAEVGPWLFEESAGPREEPDARAGPSGCHSVTRPPPAGDKSSPERVTDCHPSGCQIVTPLESESERPRSSDSARSPSIGASGSGSSVRRARLEGLKRYLAIVEPLYGCGAPGEGRHSRNSQQYEADVTCGADWFDQLVWPRGADLPAGRARIDMVERHARTARAKRRPMAWLGRVLRRELAEVPR